MPQGRPATARLWTRKNGVLFQLFLKEAGGWLVFPEDLPQEQQSSDTDTERYDKWSVSCSFLVSHEDHQDGHCCNPAHYELILFQMHQ